MIFGRSAQRASTFEPILGTVLRMHTTANRVRTIHRAERSALAEFSRFCVFMKLGLRVVGGRRRCNG